MKKMIILNIWFLSLLCCSIIISSEKIDIAKVSEAVSAMCLKEMPEKFDFQTIFQGPSGASIGTYNSLQITSENILNFAQGMPDYVRIGINKWLNENAEAIKYIMHRRNALSQVRQEMTENNEMLKKSSLENWSKWNYTIPVSIKEENDYCIQISGPLIRLGNIAAYNKTFWEDVKEKSGIEGINALPTVPTFQSASRLAHYLRLQEFFSIEKKHQDAHQNAEGFLLNTMPLYALMVPWSNSNSSDDENLIIVQEVLKGPKILLKDANKKGTLTNDQISQLFRMVKYVGFWSDLTSNIFVQNDKLYTFDFEQPGNSNPEDFFQKNLAKYHWNLTGAIKGIMDEFIIPESDQYNFFRDLILNDPMLQDPRYNPYRCFYQKLFAAR